jgi:hypothetical protein
LPDTIPTQEQYERAASAHAARVKAMETDFQVVNTARRIILTIFVPLVVCLFTYSIEIKIRDTMFLGEKATVVRELQDVYPYWGLLASASALFLWILWGPTPERPKLVGPRQDP